MRKYKKNITFAIYTAIHTFTVLVPCLIAAAAGTQKTNLFCEKNPNLCDDYSSTMNIELPNQLAKTTKMFSFALGLNSAFIPGIISMLFIAVIRCLSKQLQSKKNILDEETTPILPNHYNPKKSCELFKKFKAQVTRSDLCLLPIIIVAAIGSCALISWIIAVEARNIICNDFTNTTNSTNTTHFSDFIFLTNSSNYTHCIRNFPHATINELQTILALSHNVYNIILEFGIVLGAAFAFLGAGATLGISACIKHRLDPAPADDFDSDSDDGKPRTINFSDGCESDSDHAEPLVSNFQF